MAPRKKPSPHAQRQARKRRKGPWSARPASTGAVDAGKIDVDKIAAELDQQIRLQELAKKQAEMDTIQASSGAVSLVRTPNLRTTVSFQSFMFVFAA